MSKGSVTAAACAALLCAGTALATPTPQQNCDHARVRAWNVYTSCVDRVIAMHVRGASRDLFAPFAKCRHAYFQKWTAFQPKAPLAGSTCIGPRFTDNGDGTVTDGLTTLVWEKKTNLDSTPNSADPHDADNAYTWSTGSNNGDGTAFTTFLTDATTGLNTTGFAGANDWRLPTVAELQTIVLDFPCTGGSWGPTCTCPSTPCVDPALDAATTQYWGTYSSATSYLPDPSFAWYVSFYTGASYGFGPKTTGSLVRAVRGGL